MTAIVYVTRDFGFRRGEIYFADLDPHYGSEQGSERSVIVTQNNTENTPNNPTNNGRGIIQSNIDLNVSTNGQISFNQGNQDSFAIVGITIEDIKI